MAALLRLAPADCRELRHTISAGLAEGSPRASRWQGALMPLACVQLGMPWDIAEYTDFYTGIHHATNVGRLFRPDEPLMPNYKWMPIGYHGRASTVMASGSAVIRPHGQALHAPGRARLAPTQQLDFELELGAVVGRGNDGAPVPVDRADEHLFGLVLLNDWSARDVQAWEYRPLGPFLSKNFATTVSPWIVTLDALLPFRRPAARPAADPPLLPYLDGAMDRATGNFDIALAAAIRTAAMQDVGHVPDIVTRVDAGEAAYWTLAQLVAHHTINGCRLHTGDLLGSGTLSGPRREQAGSLLELTQGGRERLPVGPKESRTWLEDGDTVVMTGQASRPGFRSIGFGECRGAIAAAIPPLSAAPRAQPSPCDRGHAREQWSAA